MAIDSFRDYLLDQLAELRGVDVRPMFGGYGLYSGGTFFGILFRSRVYFKTDLVSRKDYLDREMKPFRPNTKQTLKNYYEVPADVIDDAEALAKWARRAIAAGTGRRRGGR